MGAFGQPVYVSQRLSDKIKSMPALISNSRRTGEDALRLKEQVFIGIKLRFRNDDPKEDLKVVECLRLLGTVWLLWLMPPGRCFTRF